MKIFKKVKKSYLLGGPEAVRSFEPGGAMADKVRVDRFRAILRRSPTSREGQITVGQLANAKRVGQEIAAATRVSFSVVFWSVR